MLTSTDEAAAAYCEKDDTRLDGPWTWGIRPEKSPGKRNDLLVVAQDVQAGKTLEEIAFLHPCQFIKFHGGIGRLVEMQPLAKPVPRVHWYWGGSGLGKSHHAYHEDLIEVGLEILHCPPLADDVEMPWPSDRIVGISNPPPRLFESYTTNMNRWVFDDYCEPHCRYEDLKRYIDKYPVVVSAMYRSIRFVPAEIVITCTYPPSHFWEGTKLKQIERRLENIVKFVRTEK